MDRSIYLSQLDILKETMQGKNSKLAEYGKVIALSRMMMKIEDIYDLK